MMEIGGMVYDTRVSTEVTFGQGALSTFPLAYFFQGSFAGFEAPQGAPQGENTKGAFVKGHLCAYFNIRLL